MHYIKDTLFTNWHVMRWLRLGLGLIMGVQAMQRHDVLAGFISFFFLYQAATNTGCCGVAGCSVPGSTGKTEKTEEVEYEEIKSIEK